MPEPASQDPGGSVVRVLRTHRTLRHAADAACYVVFISHFISDISRIVHFFSLKQYKKHTSYYIICLPIWKHSAILALERRDDV